MKRKITILLFMIYATANIYSQNYNISFTSTGAANTVDTVKVENLTQNLSLTMSGTDILHLGDVGINEFEVNRNNLKIYPNPMYGKAELMFYADKESEVLVNVIDIKGLEILKIALKAEKGVHKFQLNGLRQGMYFVSVRSETYSYSSKLISQNTNQANVATILYLGYENAETDNIKLKNTNATVNMPYTDGDLLLFKGESGSYTNIITDVPTSSKTITFNFTACTDGDSNNYTTVDIGTQIWMAENLKTPKYRNGVLIPNVTNDTVWSSLTTGARCYYNNDSATYSNTYGALYNGYLINNGNLCPTGWHIPNDLDWIELTNYLGGDSIAGGKLKTTTLWFNPNVGASNETGFSALPSGIRSYYGVCWDIGLNGIWWTAIDSSVNTPFIRYVSHDSKKVYRVNNYDKRHGLSVRCLKGDLSTVSSETVTGITQTSAISGGNITSDGGSSITAKGVCWSTSHNPTIADNKTIDGNGIGNFTSNITGLTVGTIYYVRAYTTNSVGTAYGNEISFSTLPYIYPLYDIESNGYDTVHIGTQIWMKQNLKTSSYRNGIIIPNVTNDTAWNGLSTGARCYYNNDSAIYSNTYGALYNWYTVNTGNLCPTGWHVPTDAEWTTLTTYLGGENIAGSKLKATTLWNNPNTGATNSSGFSAFPGGYRENLGMYYCAGNCALWWSSTEANTTHVWYREIYNNNSAISRYGYLKTYGFSVRCLRD